MALVHDHLCGVGGSERVFQYLCEEFKEADIYALAYNPRVTLPFFATREIRTTWLNSFIRNAETFRWFFPLATHVMRQLDLSHYDLVLSSSATVAKYVKGPKGGHICYCYIPTRALWHFEQYFGKSLKRELLRPFLSRLKSSDYVAAQKIDHFIAISASSKNYIKQYYAKEADVLHCPIETEKFVIQSTKKEHYLLVSRLERWKKVEYAVEAFNWLGKPLRIIGKGGEEKKLRKMAKANVAFLGEVDDAQLAREYAECRAVVFTPFLEYGLIPLEANACGTPVICYGRGGVLETMIPPESSLRPTAFFFYEQTAEALARAVEQFEQISFDPYFLAQHASRWSVPVFQAAMRRKIEDFKRSKK